MGEAKRKRELRQATIQASHVPQTQKVASLLDAMQDGKEYNSIVGLLPSTDESLLNDVRRAIVDLENVRGRRCVCYLGNVIKPSDSSVGIEASDHLPFNEMVSLIPQDVTAIDVFLVTPGGLAETVTQFVDALRMRFTSVEFILPYQAMSAGTLWALSGERIWMDSRACLGPVDPQVRAKDGSFVPAQALQALFREIHNQAEAAIKDGRPIPWSFVRLLHEMDQQKLGQAITYTNYVIDIATRYLENYKFRLWTEHSSTKLPVTLEERKKRAAEVARIMCDHQRWKAHAHAINREAVFQELQIKVDELESIPGLERAVRRLWALLYYVFDKSKSQKIILSSEYTFVRNLT